MKITVPKAPSVRFENGRKYVDNPSSEFPQDAAVPKSTALPAISTTRKLNRRRTVGDPSTLYQQPVTKRDPNAKPAGTFTPNND